MKNLDVSQCDTFPDEVEVDVNILGALMLNGVNGHIDSVDVVAVDQ